jgi:UDPglucose 6-dehydrogenase
VVTSPARDLAVVGAGNMGVSVLGAFLSRGRPCVAIDLDAAKVRELSLGRSVVPEVGAAEILARALGEGRLEATTDLARVAGARAVFVAVQTPYKGADCDYTALRSVLRDLARVAPPGQTIVVGSTVFPGGIERELLPELAARKDLELVYEPVFLRAGFGIDDYLRPGKLIFGLADPAKPPAALGAIFAPVIEREATFASFASAEWIKVVHNAFMSVKVCFANEVATLCRSFDADVEAVLRATFEEGPRGRLMTLSHMLPGPPYSGPCLPKDAIVLGGLLAKHGEPWMRGASVLEALRTSNEAYTEHLVLRWIELGRAAKKPLGVIGVAFRADFNEVRGSLALPFIRRAKRDGLPVLAYDPFFEGISPEAHALAARGDREVEALRETLSHSLEDVWSRSGVVLLNRRLDARERARVSGLATPLLVDLYGNGWEERA